MLLVFFLFLFLSIFFHQINNKHPQVRQKKITYTHKLYLNSRSENKTGTLTLHHHNSLSSALPLKKTPLALTSVIPHPTDAGTSHGAHTDQHRFRALSLHLSRVDPQCQPQTDLQPPVHSAWKSLYMQPERANSITVCHKGDELSELISRKTLFLSILTKLSWMTTYCARHGDCFLEATGFVCHKNIWLRPSLCFCPEGC